jgi:hypothetical protein
VSPESEKEKEIVGIGGWLLMVEYKPGERRAELGIPEEPT